MSDPALHRFLSLCSRAMEELGATHELLCIVGSFRESMDDDYCLREMAGWLRRRQLGIVGNEDFKVIASVEVPDRV